MIQNVAVLIGLFRETTGEQTSENLESIFCTAKIMIIKTLREEKSGKGEKI